MAFPTQSADLEDSSSQELTATDSASLSIVGDITVECWVKPESFNAAQPNFLMAKNDAGASRNWQFLVQGTDPFFITFGVNQDGAGTIPTSADGTIDVNTYLGTWVHFAATWDAGLGNIPILYINGVVDTVSSSVALASSIADSGVVTRIGRQGGTTRYWDGRFGLARVWSIVRTQAEIQADMCRVLGATTGLAAEWTLDNTLNDNSGNSNTLTNVNSVTFGADVAAICAPAHNYGFIQNKLRPAIFKPGHAR